METEQLNIRVPKELVADLEVISKLLKVNKSEWVKTKMAEEAHKEKNRLLLELSKLYANGLISKKSIEKIVGSAIAENMEFLKEKAKDSILKGSMYGKSLKTGIRV